MLDPQRYILFGRRLKEEIIFLLNNSDEVQRFFWNHSKNKLLPKESKTYTISFRSTIHGMFFEEYEIITEPACLTPLKVLTLNGISVQQE